MLTLSLLLGCLVGATPDAGASLLPPPPDDPVTQLYRKALDFRNGEPGVPVRVMEGAREVQFSGLGRVRIQLFGKVPKTVEGPAGQAFRVRLTHGAPAQLRTRIQVGEFRFADRAGWTAERDRLEQQGLNVEVNTLGALSGIAGKVLDNRRQVLVLDEEPSPARLAELRRLHGLKALAFETLTEPAHGTLALIDEHGAPLGEAQDLITVDTLDASGLAVKQVEYGVGYDFHGYEDRSYRGGLQFAPDRTGRLAVINHVALEELLEGLVPSELFARAHPEALKAQAVTARGEVLAKIGLKHLADPYVLCSEQHCAVYKGRGGEAPTTNAAVLVTRGEALFSRDGRLVDSVYSAVCGGHTESNENVWGGPPDPSLRGRPDLLEAASGGGDPQPDAGQRSGVPGVSPKNLAQFLKADLPAACRLSSFAQPAKYRWERRFSAAEMNTRTAMLGVGPIRAIAVTERGVSGRARMVTLSGETGATQVQGELEIRRLFGMLNSSMFLVEPQLSSTGTLEEWVFRGGGWGHGVGMCQTGAVGRAEAGQDYRAILRYYFSGAEVAPIY